LGGARHLVNRQPVSRLAHRCAVAERGERHRVIIAYVTLLRVSDSGQVYDVDLNELRITPDQAGGFYVHGKGYFIYFETFDEAEEKKKELEYRGAY
jgi:hypothetical protein